MSIGSCSQTCGGGTQQYERYKTAAPSCGGSCSGGYTKISSCNTGGCPGKNTAYDHICIYKIIVVLIRMWYWETIVNIILQQLIALAIRLLIGIVARVLVYAPSEKVTVTLIPIAM